MKKNATYSATGAIKKIEKTKVQRSEKRNWLDLTKSAVLKNSVITAVFILMIINGTMTISKVWGGNLLWTWNYWQVLLGGAVIILVGWVQGKIQIETAAKLCKIYIAFAIVFFLINTVVPDTTLKTMGKAARDYFTQSPTPAPDEGKLVRKVVFEKTYTYDDAFEKEHGQIHTFKFIDDGVNIGDKIEVIAQSISASSFSGDEIWIFQCGKCQSQWAKTANGYYVDTVEQAPQGKYFLISLGGRQDIKVIVRATKYIST